MRRSVLTRRKKKFVLYRIRKNLLAIIAGLLAMFAIFSMLLFYLSERRIYQQSLEGMNEVMANQVVAVYELYLQNAKEIAHETVYNNQEILRLLGRGEKQSRGEEGNFGIVGFCEYSKFLHSFGVSVL